MGGCAHQSQIYTRACEALTELRVDIPDVRKIRLAERNDFRASEQVGIVVRKLRANSTVVSEGIPSGRNGYKVQEGPSSFDMP